MSPDLSTLRLHGVTLRLDPTLELGAGGEARVFALPGDRERVAKIYREPSPERARKIARMIAHPPRLGPDPEAAVRLAWPQEVVVDAEGRSVGFLMPRAEGPRVFEFYNPVTRRTQAPLFHYGLLHRAGANLAAAFAALHERGYVVGDVNESNILVAPDGAVTLVDTDGFQVPDPAAGTYRSRVGRPEFTPPELQGVSFGAADRTEAHDRFGLGVLLFLLLMEGTHPFAVRVAGATEPPPVEERIRAGMFPYAGAPPHRGCTPPRMALPFAVLHPGVRVLFERCFVDGHHDPAARPTAAEWRDALREAEAGLRRCDLNPQHRFGGHLGDCPWCARAHQLRGRDPFPATAEAARRVAAPVPRRTHVARPGLSVPRVRAPRIVIPPVPLTTRAAAAARQAARDPAVYVFPLLLLAMLPLGVAQLFAAIAALAALQPRATPRSWGVLVAAMLFLTVATGVTADLLSGPRHPPRYAYDPPLPPPPVDDAGPPADDPAWVAEGNRGRIRDIGMVEEAPHLNNRAAVARALERGYPPLLRDAGVGGTVSLGFVIDAAGRVEEGSIKVLDSDNAAFSGAARGVVRVMRFAPARVHGRPVRVRVELPISFQPQY
jgi:TonB family protein